MNIRPYFTVKIMFCAVVCRACNVHLYSTVLSNGQKILFSCRVDIITDEHIIVQVATRMMITFVRLLQKMKIQ